MQLRNGLSAKSGLVRRIENWPPLKAWFDDRFVLGVRVYSLDSLLTLPVQLVQRAFGKVKYSKTARWFRLRVLRRKPTPLPRQATDEEIRRLM